MTLKDLSQDRHNNLNIIRLFASLLVLYMHSFSVCIGDQRQDITGILTGYKQLSGGLAVDIFFIISGFLICRSYDRSKSLWAYVKARFLRIWPLLFVVVCLTTFIIGPILTEHSLSLYFRSNWFGFFRNAFFINTYSMLPGVFNNHYNHSLNGSLWTLQYEVICYILVVLTAFLWKRFRATAPVFTLVLAGFYLYGTYISPIDVGFVSTDFVANFARLAMFFCMGMTYYRYQDYIHISWKLCLIAIAGLVLGTILTNFEIVFAIFGSYIIFFIAFQKMAVASWYDKVGDLSYGVYVMAFPIQQILVDTLGQPSEYYKTMTMNPYLNMVLTLAIVLPLSWLSWRFIESPCLRLKDFTIKKG